MRFFSKLLDPTKLWYLVEGGPSRKSDSSVSGSFKLSNHVSIGIDSELESSCRGTTLGCRFRSERCVSFARRCPSSTEVVRVSGHARSCSRKSVGHWQVVRVTLNSSSTSCGWCTWKSIQVGSQSSTGRCTRSGLLGEHIHVVGSRHYWSRRLGRGSRSCWGSRWWSESRTSRSNAAAQVVSVRPQSCSTSAGWGILGKAIQIRSHTGSRNTVARSIEGRQISAASGSSFDRGTGRSVSEKEIRSSGRFILGSIGEEEWGFCRGGRSRRSDCRSGTV
mmetsp:Transcript_26087/g.52247  ORF Transcript_26087/g.52247 Transcript_26087/m.52247 type:complete len:277 (+) Transcript_26087:222-1052(+)